jgi:hypothetical protein
MSDVLGTERIGQLTGSSRTLDAPELTTDWIFWPLMNETGRWGVNGVDLGANTEHRGRLYIFFGDVALDGSPDLVCWTTDDVVQRHGGHVAIGWDFCIPNDHQGATPETGQPHWRLCAKCHGMFFCPDDVDAGVCSAGGAHAPTGWDFVLPNDHQGATTVTGQAEWRFCGRCSGLFWGPPGEVQQTVCPAGGAHTIPPGSWNFSLPAAQTGASETSGQPQWRFCANCHSLYWNGDSIKGVCPAALGGGFRLNAVGGPRSFEPFVVDAPIGPLGSDETPTGAFSYADRAYVFVWVGVRPGDGPTAGSYLTSIADPGMSEPDSPRTYRIEQLISPYGFIETSFSQIAPVLVDNAASPGVFPQSSGDGVVLVGQGHNALAGDDAIHVAWSPLQPEPRSAPLTLSYLTGDGAQPWSTDPNDAVPLIPRPGVTSVSAAWLPGPQRWLVIYGTANPSAQGGPVDGPVMARLARTPAELADVPDFELFHPGREYAYGNYMHWPGSDRINPDLPPSQPPPADDPGWAYGAHVLNRFTTWDPHKGLIELFYLMSTASPYQVHLMHTTIRFA